MALLSGCAAFKQYRIDYHPYVNTAPDVPNEGKALQEVRDSSPADPGYLLGTIEFDDQGQLWDPIQADAVIQQIDSDIVGHPDDALIVVFVHGWKHNAVPHDPNLVSFGEALDRLSRTEAALSRHQHRAKRKIVGVYMGWRGASITAPVLKELTFWERKSTAQKVGHGDLTAVLTQLDQIRLARDREAQESHTRSRTRLVIVGHSFGAEAVYSAVGQIMAQRFVATEGPATVGSDIEGFGNLVVLVNPAFEASQYAPLSDLSTARGTYFTSQLPLLAILTSEHDQATGTWFPIGRWFSTRFEKERVVPRLNPISHQTERIDQRESNLRAVGHFELYRTHRLAAAAAVPAGTREQTAEASAKSVDTVSEQWENDHPGSVIAFPGTELTRTDRSAGRDPYLVVSVDPALIPDHNYIWNDKVEEFIAQLVLVSSQSADLEERKQERKAE